MSTRHIPCNNCGSDTHRHLVTVRGNRGVPFIEKYHTVVVCSKCGLVFLNPQHEPDDYKKFYTGQNVKELDRAEIQKTIEGQDDSRFAIRDFLMNNLSSDFLEKKPTLLDVGCGVGVFLLRMRDAGFSVEGLEPGALERAYATEHGLKVHGGMLSENSLSSTQYDVVTALAFIEHVNDPLATIKSLWKLVKDDGYILLTTPSYHHMNLRHGPENYFKFVHTFYFSEKTLASLMKQAGFSIVKVWVKESPYRNSFFFGRVPTRGGSLLCIVGKKETTANLPAPDFENVDDVVRSFTRAKNAAWLQYSSDRVLRYVRALWNLFKNKVL